MTAYDLRISDWSSDVCSSDLIATTTFFNGVKLTDGSQATVTIQTGASAGQTISISLTDAKAATLNLTDESAAGATAGTVTAAGISLETQSRSEEHTSELQSLMRISYAVFCLKKKNKNTSHHNTKHT